MPPEAGHNSPHPVAEAAERAILAGRKAEVRQSLETALESEPDHPDLLAAQGLLLAYKGQESRAMDLLERCIAVERGVRLAQLLGRHFSARVALAQKLSAEDEVANEALAKIEKQLPLGFEGHGIRLSACLIVKNESRHLARCLKSLTEVVDEIVVIDTGSMDDTVAIAEAYGAVTGSIEWTQDFSAARNHSLEMATGDWVLWIDADEVLAAGSAEAIHCALVRPQFGGFAIEIVNYTEDGTNDAQYVHRPIRLFQRHDSIRFTGRIHEQISPAIEALGLPWAHLDGAQILHEGYRPSEMAAKGKLDRTVEMVAREVQDDPNNAFQWFNLANAHTAAGDFANAAIAAAQCVGLIAEQDQVGALAYQLWSNALLKTDRANEALQVCDEADRRGFGGLLNEFERANACLALGKVEEGIVAANRSLAFDWPQSMTGDIGIAQYKRYITRGQLLAVKGDFSEAVSMFDRALRANPQYGPAMYSRAATHEQMGEFEKALEGFLAGQENASVGSMCLKGAGRVCIRLGLPKRASELFQEAWRRSPEDHDAWVGWVQAAEAYGDVQVIVEAYASFAESHQPTADMLVNWGRALDAMGECDRALACYTEAILRDATNANAFFNCGDLFYKLERFDEAAEVYQSGLKLDPQNPSGWFVLGNALARLGIADGARVSYQQALILKPDYQEAKHNLNLIRSAA